MNAFSSASTNGLDEDVLAAEGADEAPEGVLSPSASSVPSTPPESEIPHFEGEPVDKVVYTRMVEASIERDIREVPDLRKILESEGGEYLRHPGLRTLLRHVSSMEKVRQSPNHFPADPVKSDARMWDGPRAGANIIAFLIQDALLRRAYDMKFEDGEIIWYRKESSVTPASSIHPDATKMEDVPAKILLFLQSGPKSTHQMMRVTNRSRAAIRRMIAQLEAKGKVERIGIGNDTRYILS